MDKESNTSPSSYPLKTPVCASNIAKIIHALLKNIDRVTQRQKIEISHTAPGFLWPKVSKEEREKRCNIACSQMRQDILKLAEELGISGESLENLQKEIENMNLGKLEEKLDTLKKS